MSNVLSDGIVVATLVSIALLAGVGSGATAPEEPSTNATTPRIVEVVPNPVASNDRGEHVVISFPESTALGNWSIDDGETVVRLPDRRVSGRVALSSDPGEAVGRDRVIGLDGRLALANAGETLRLLRRNATISTVTYENAPEGERYVRADGAWTWRPTGATGFPVASVADARVRTFVLPDAANVAIDALRNARDRVLLAGYTFESTRTVSVLCALRRRGVTVRVLLEREPVGGLTTRAAERFEELVACGVPVELLGGPHARYSFHHAKYAIVDDAALVLSENWKPSGVGGRSNRGWGVLIQDAAFASELTAVFDADASWRDTVHWSETGDVGVVDPVRPAASGRYPTRFRPANARAERVDLLLAPDNAAEAVVDLLDSADESIRIQQVAIGSRDHPFVNATLRAARRGVPVRILLSSADYAWHANRDLADHLNELARSEGLPLRVRLVDPRSRFGRLHVKGVLVDDAVLVGSLNWNAHATRENREVAVVLHGQEVSEYYARVFRSDWRGGVWRLPIGAFGATLLGAFASVVAAGRMRFEPPSPAATPEGDDGRR